MSTMIDVPAREGRAVRLRAGERFRVIDPEGGQVGDLFAFSADDITEHASAEHTRVFVARLFPRPGEPFVTNRRRPILYFEEDASPGIHDMLLAACDPTRYSLLGVQGHHASCQDNLRAAMAEQGFPVVKVPQPINLFMNIPIGEDGGLGFEVAPTAPGDYVTFRAEMECYLALSACPQDLNPINRGGPKPLQIELLDA
jgi:uncharacterized protein